MAVAHASRCVALFIALFLLVTLMPARAEDCAGTSLAGIGGVSKLWKLSDRGVAAFAKMNINLDGSGRAYHPDNALGGALVHLCNAGRVYLPDGTHYEGSESNATCTGRFMNDVARIRQAGWHDPSIGAVHWYGILGEGSVTINGRTVDAVTPVLNKNGSGFYVSPTSLFDPTVSDPADQSRYVDPLRVASAVIPNDLGPSGIAMGSFGVAINVKKNIAVPFVVGDRGPRIGEGSIALARLAAGFPLTDKITRANRYVGQVDERDVLWVFFGDAATTFHRGNEDAVTTSAQAAFARWGGQERLARCAAVVPRI